MRKIFTFGAIFIVCLVVASICTFTNADADGNYYNVLFQATVQSRQVSLREAPSTSSKRYMYLKNGQLADVIGEDGDWYIIDMSNLTENGGIAYALKRFFDVDSWMLVLPNSVRIYSSTWENAGYIGEYGKGESFRVIDENDNWYAVQLNKSNPGTGFIRKRDLKGAVNMQNTPVPYGTKAIVLATSLKVFPAPDDNREAVTFLHYEDVVTVSSWGEYFTRIVWTNGQECYVHTKYIQELQE